jgi:hypothetical protein
MLVSKLAWGIVIAMNAARLTAIALAASAFLVAVAGPASADRMRRAPAADPTRPHITVQSDLYPSETISAPVRRGPRGDEVRLPGGTWVPCSFNCYFTLRNATVDFWRRYDVFPQ